MPGIDREEPVHRPMATASARAHQCRIPSFSLPGHSHVPESFRICGPGLGEDRDELWSEEPTPLHYMHDPPGGTHRTCPLKGIFAIEAPLPFAVEADAIAGHRQLHREDPPWTRPAQALWPRINFYEPAATQEVAVELGSTWRHRPRAPAHRPFSLCTGGWPPPGQRPRKSCQGLAKELGSTRPTVGAADHPMNPPMRFRRQLGSGGAGVSAREGTGRDFPLHRANRASAAGLGEPRATLVRALLLRAKQKC